MRGHVVQSECGQARELFPSRDLWSRCVDVAQRESPEMLHRRGDPRQARRVSNVKARNRKRGSGEK